MRLLLDTHVWLRWFIEPDGLNNSVLEVLAEEGHDVFLSAASVWEMSIKFALGKLDLPSHPRSYVPDRLREQGMFSLPVDIAHAAIVADLPHHHRDPFDRMLVAQAQSEDLVLVTADGAIKDYDVQIFWAG